MLRRIVAVNRDHVQFSGKVLAHGRHVVSINFIGLATTVPCVFEPQDSWLEVVPPASRQPANLYAAQLERRKGAKR